MKRFVMGVVAGVLLTTAAYTTLGMNRMAGRNQVVKNAIEAAVTACHTDPVTFDRYYMQAEAAIGSMPSADRETFEVILNDRLNELTFGGGANGCRK